MVFNEEGEEDQQVYLTEATGANSENPRTPSTTDFIDTYLFEEESKPSEKEEEQSDLEHSREQKQKDEEVSGFLNQDEDVLSNLEHSTENGGNDASGSDKNVEEEIPMDLNPPSDSTGLMDHLEDEEEKNMDKEDQGNEDEMMMEGTKIDDHPDGENEARNTDPETVNSTADFLATLTSYSRKEDKMKELRQHPMVVNVADDGKEVECKCGRLVRLNPAWYILKYEQHLVSRNCGRLKNPGKKRKKRPSKMSKDELKLLKREQKIIDKQKTLNEILMNPPGEGASVMKVKRYENCKRIKEHPKFSRITSDGRHLECVCKRIVKLNPPWHIGKFDQHVASRNCGRPEPKRNRRKRMKHEDEELDVFALDEMKRKTRLKSEKTPNDIKWETMDFKNTVPCPGIRGENITNYVSSAMQLTGGSRPRHKIARELFPDVFPPGEKCEINKKLCATEKQMLHDAVQKEALWIVDKEGHCVRSFDCIGIKEPGMHSCRKCSQLKAYPSFRTAICAPKNKAKNPLTRKFCPKAYSSMDPTLSSATKGYARDLRELFMAHKDDGNPSNFWLDIAEMGMAGEFDLHPAMVGLIKSMVKLKDKERRGVGMQNMGYSGAFDQFMTNLSTISPESFDLFQQHLCGRTHRSQKKTTMKVSSTNSHLSSQQIQHHHQLQQHQNGQLDSTGSSLRAPPPADSLMALLAASTEGSGNVHGPGSGNGVSSNHHDLDEMTMEQELSNNLMLQHHHLQQQQQQHTHHSSQDEHELVAQQQYQHHHQEQQQLQLDLQHEVALHHHQQQQHLEQQPQEEEEEEEEEDDEEETMLLKNESKEQQGDLQEENLQSKELMKREEKVELENKTKGNDEVACSGIRTEKVQAYIEAAMQLTGGSRPRHVIARELYPDIFPPGVRVEIVKKLDDAQKLMLHDAMHREAVWRVDKIGRSVRSLRCQRVCLRRFKACESCRKLKNHASFRSVLSRARKPKNPDNVKYVPSTFTESDPFLRKISKNSAFRSLYLNSKDNKQSEEMSKFWLKVARMGINGEFRSHPVMEGLVQSMIEIKDKERRGVGKQNMQYSKPLDEFMNTLSSISLEAFELFSEQFCGRSLRSQKILKKKSMGHLTSTTTHHHNMVQQQHMGHMDSGLVSGLMDPNMDRHMMDRMMMEGLMNDRGLVEDPRDLHHLRDMHHDQREMQHERALQHDRAMQERAFLDRAIAERVMQERNLNETVHVI